MNQIFNFNTKKILVLKKDDTILFDPKEIGECLEIGELQIRDKVTALEDGIEKVHLSRAEIESMFEGQGLNLTLGNAGKTFITESGVYQFVMESRSQKAKEFKTWLCREVLPSIRKHGMYATPMTVEQMISDPAHAIALLQALQKEQESRKLAEAAREKAEKERLWIRSKAEATAMATASVKSRALEKLKLEMGEHKEYASILRVAIATVTSEKDYNWRPLKQYSEEHGLEIHSIPDPRFGKVKTYHKDAWYNVYDIDLEELFA